MSAPPPVVDAEEEGFFSGAVSWVGGGISSGLDSAWSVGETGLDGLRAVGSTIASANPFAETPEYILTGPTRALTPEQQASVTAATTQLLDGIGGTFDGTDEDAIRNALRGKTPDEIAEIRRLYHDRSGGDHLENALRGELSGTAFDEAMAQLSGDPVRAAVASLNAATYGVGTREGTINDVLSGLTQDQVHQVHEEWARSHGGASLFEELDLEMDGNELGVSTALANGNLSDTDRIARANAFRLDEAMNGGFLGFGTDEDTVEGVLGSAQTAEQRAAVERAYGQVTSETHWFGGETLAEGIDDEMDGARQNLADALRTGDRVQAGAARIELATDGLGTDTGALFAAVAARGGQDAVAAWEQRYRGGRRGSFEEMTHGELGDMDFERVSELAFNGRLNSSFAMRYAMSGPGADTQMMRETLRGKSRAEIDRIAADFEAGGNGDLRSEIRSQTAGRDEFDLIDTYDYGEARTTEERVARSNRVYDHERGSSVSNFLIDRFSDAGERLDREHEAINRPGASGAELQQHLRNAADDVTSTRAAEDSVANGASTLASAVAMLTTAGASTVPQAMIGALITGGAGMAARVPIQGFDYLGTDAMTADAVGVAASVAAAGLTQGAFASAGSMQQAAQQGVSGLITGGAGALASTSTYRGDVEDGLFAVLKGTALGGLAGLVGGGVTGRLGARLQGGALRPDMQGAVSGAAGAVAGSLVNPDVMSLSWDDLMRRSAWNAVTGWANGALSTPSEDAASTAFGPGLEPPIDVPLPALNPGGSIDLDLPAPASWDAAPSPWATTAPDTMESLMSMAGPDNTMSEATARFVTEADARAIPTLDAAAVQRQVYAGFSPDAVTAPTEVLTTAEAAAQRTHRARELMAQQAALGITPGEGMDPRIVERVQDQQRLLEQVRRLRDDLGVSELDVNNVLPASALDVAESQDPDAPRTVGDVAATRQRLRDLGYSDARIAAMPTEQQLVLAGYSPEAIVAHFTARDLDYDVTLDESQPNAQAREAAYVRDAINPYDILPPLAATGDLNSDGANGLAPTVRRPVTQAEADRAVGMNAVLRELFDVDGLFAKIIPPATVGDLTTGTPTEAYYGPPAVYPGSALQVAGDIGRAVQTEQPADRSDRPATSMDGVRVMGPDYPTGERPGYIVLDPSAPQGVRVSPELESGRGMDRLVGEVTPEIERRAAVPVGRAVAQAAQRVSRALLGLGGDTFVPRMLQRDDSVDQMPRVMERNRSSQSDTRSGGGYSVTERLDLPVVPNQELTIERARGAGAPLPADARVENMSPTGTRETILVCDGGHMTAPAGVSPENQAFVEAQHQAAQARIAAAQRR